jgi:hypothetical protein
MSLLECKVTLGERCRDAKSGEETQLERAKKE